MRRRAGRRAAADFFSAARARRTPRFIAASIPRLSLNNSEIVLPRRSASGFKDCAPCDSIVHGRSPTRRPPGDAIGSVSFRVIVDAPAICDGQVEMDQVRNATGIAAPDYIWRYRVASIPNADCHAADGEVSAGKPHEDEVKLVPRGAELSDPRSECAACQRGLERETCALLRELFQTCQHDPTCLERGSLGIEPR